MHSANKYRSLVLITDLSDYKTHRHHYHSAMLAPCPKWHRSQGIEALSIAASCNLLQIFQLLQLQCMFPKESWDYHYGSQDPQL